jgi:hypothetical protein
MPPHLPAQQLAASNMYITAAKFFSRIILYAQIYVDKQAQFC